MEIEGKRMTLITLYDPNKDTPELYMTLSEMNQSIVITGDYNLVQNQHLDTYNYQNINNPKAKEKVLDLIEFYNLTDPFREINQTLKNSHGENLTPRKQARLDFF